MLANSFIGGCDMVRDPVRKGIPLNEFHWDGLCKCCPKFLDLHFLTSTLCRWSIWKVKICRIRATTQGTLTTTQGKWEDDTSVIKWLEWGPARELGSLCPRQAALKEPRQPGEWPVKQSSREHTGGKKEQGKRKTSVMQSHFGHRH